MRCRLSEMHYGVGGGETSFLWGKQAEEKTLPILQNINSSVSDHYFAALVTIRALKLLIGISFKEQPACSNEQFTLRRI